MQVSLQDFVLPTYYVISVILRIIAGTDSMTDAKKSINLSSDDVAKLLNMERFKGYNFSDAIRNLVSDALNDKTTSSIQKYANDDTGLSRFIPDIYHTNFTQVLQFSDTLYISLTDPNRFFHLYEHRFALTHRGMNTKTFYIIDPKVTPPTSEAAKHLKELATHCTCISAQCHILFREGHDLPDIMVANKHTLWMTPQKTRGYPRLPIWGMEYKYAEHYDNEHSRIVGYTKELIGEHHKEDLRVRK